MESHALHDDKGYDAGDSNLRGIQAASRLPPVNSDSRVYLQGQIAAAGFAGGDILHRRRSVASARSAVFTGQEIHIDRDHTTPHH